MYINLLKTNKVINNCVTGTAIRDLWGPKSRQLVCVLLGSPKVLRGPEQIKIYVIHKHVRSLAVR